MHFTCYATSIALTLLPLAAEAQCFNRVGCPDPTALEVRSQISIQVPIADRASSEDTLKVMEGTQRDLYALSKRECDTLKDIFGGDCSLSSVNTNSSVQDRGMNNKAAFVSVSNTYELKRPQK